MAVSEWLIRSAFQILTLWAYLVYGNQIAAFLLGRQPSNAELGIVAVMLFIVSYVFSSFVIRGIRSGGEAEA